MSKQNLDLRVHDSHGGFDQLYQPWLALMRDVEKQCFYHQPEWFKAFLDAYSDLGDSIRFFSIYRDEKLVAVFPAQFRTRGKFPKLREIVLPVTHQLYMPDSVMSDNENPAELLTYFLENVTAVSGEPWDVFSVRNTLENSSIALANADSGRYRSVSGNQGRCSLIPVIPYDEAMAAMKTKARQNLNRRRRKFSELGDVSYSIASSSEDTASALHEYIELEAAGWKGGKGSLRGQNKVPLAIALNPSKQRFYEGAIAALSERGLIEIFCLRLNGELVAARVWVVLNDCCYALKTSYDERYDKYSPGTLTFDYAYRYHADKGDVRFINPLFNQPALAPWRPQNLHYKTDLYFNENLQGRVFGLLYPLISAMRK